MSVIIIPRKHLTQLQGRVDINPSHWAAGAIVHAVAGASGAVDLAQCALVQTIGAPTRTATAQGPAFSASASTNRLSIPNSAANNPDKIIVMAVAATTGGSYTTFASKRNAASSGWMLNGVCNPLHAGNNAMFACEFNGTWKYALGPINLQGTGLHTFVGAYDGAALRIFTDGKEDQPSGTAYSGAIPTVTAPLSLLAEPGDNSSINGDLVLFAALDGNRVNVTSEFLRELSTNPYQLFRADPIRIYSFPSGPISISWSSLTASNITASGARLTLGGIVR